MSDEHGRTPWYLWAVSYISRQKARGEKRPVVRALMLGLHGQTFDDDVKRDLEQALSDVYEEAQ